MNTRRWWCQSLVVLWILQNSTKLWKFCGKWEILQLGSKFHDPRKTDGPNHQHSTGEASKKSTSETARSQMSHSHHRPWQSARQALADWYCPAQNAETLPSSQGWRYHRHLPHLPYLHTGLTSESNLHHFLTITPAYYHNTTLSWQNTPSIQPIYYLNLLAFVCLQCFDAVAWAAGRASGL